VVDTVLLRVTDAMLSFPPIFLLLALAAFVRPSLASMTLIIGATSWMDVTRMVRGQMLALREREFVQGRAGSVPRAGGSCSATFCRTRSASSRSPPPERGPGYPLESYISFLGYGIQPPLASWVTCSTRAELFHLGAVGGHLSRDHDHLGRDELQFLGTACEMRSTRGT